MPSAARLAATWRCTLGSSGCWPKGCSAISRSSTCPPVPMSSGLARRCAGSLPGGRPARGRGAEDQPPAFAPGRASEDETLALERLRGLEERLARIEETLRIAMELVDTGEAGRAEAAPPPPAISRGEQK